jgi:uncharacterized protein GlcG (DUF336 family)
MTRRDLGASLGRLTARPLFRATMVVLSVLCAAPSNCGGGGDIATNSYVIPDQTTQNLASADVDTVTRQAINEATARGKPATIAVVDRLGNVLSVVQMTGAPTAGNAATCPATAQAAPLTSPQRCVMVDSGRGVTTGLGGVLVPSTMAAVAKAITAAYLSSGGNAFSTRTASQIVQDHFNPQVLDTPGGPLFGVQFSQLPCSDFNQYNNNPAVTPGAVRPTVAGPQRSPLGLAADPGGLPIYKQGVLVGGIGVVSKTTYTLDLDVFDFDQNTAAGDDDEIIALAASSGFGAPGPIQAQNISAGGNTLRYVDATTSNFAAAVALAPDPFPASATAAPVSVPGFYLAAGAPGTGVTWGTVASGVFPDGTGPGGVGAQYAVSGGVAWTFLDASTGDERVPKAGYVPAAGFLTKAEATALVVNGLDVSFVTRGQIRIPTNSAAQISVTVVDLDGNILAQARSADAPVFGADVSIQKARSVVFFSRADAGSAFNEISAITNPPQPPSTAALGAPYTGKFADYVNAVSLSDPTLFNSGVAFSDRALGDLAQPYYPDGIDGTPPGPLSLPFASWSPFSTGLQLDLDFNDIATYGVGGAAPPTTGCDNGTVANPLLPTNAANVQPANPPGQTVEPTETKLADGLQIFPGGEPIYRGGVIVGAVGVSGDGVEQDDMVSYLAIQNLNGLNGLANAPSNIRADQLSPGGAPLSYVICPVAPFLNNRVQNAC